jgi:hypothetical protein
VEGGLSLRYRYLGISASRTIRLYSISQLPGRAESAPRSRDRSPATSLRPVFHLASSRATPSDASDRTTVATVEALVSRVRRLAARPPARGGRRARAISYRARRRRPPAAAAHMHSISQQAAAAIRYNCSKQQQARASAKAVSAGAHVHRSCLGSGRGRGCRDTVDE